MQSAAFLAIAAAFAATPYAVVDEIGHVHGPMPAATIVHGHQAPGAYGGVGYEPGPWPGPISGDVAAYGFYGGDRYYGGLGYGHGYGYGPGYCGHCGCYCGHGWFWRHCPPHDMYPHIPYHIACSDYYYFRPYNAVHYGEIQSEAVQWGAPEYLPYSRDVFEQVYARRLVELTGGISPSDAMPVQMPVQAIE